MKITFTLLGLALLAVVSCTPPCPEQQIASITNDADSANLISKRVIYEAYIKSHEGDDNDWYENIPTEKRAKFIDAILNAVKEGKLKAYTGEIGMPSNTKENELSTTQVMSLLTDTITTFTEDPDNRELIQTIATAEVTGENFSRITFVEEWYFDELSLNIEKKVVGMGFPIEVFNEQGDFMGYTRLFWVWFDDAIDLSDIEA